MRRSRRCGRFNRQLKRVRVRRNRTRVRRPTAGSPRGVLTARVVTLNAALLQSPKARRCGGRRNPVTEARANVLSSSEKRLRMRIAMPPPQFVSHQVGGRDFLEMAMEGMDVSGDIGKPGLPMKSTFFAIPEGANVDIDVSNVKSYTIPGVELYPLQEQPVDQRPPTPKPPIDTFLEPPFELNNRAYDSKAKFPSTPVDGGALGAMRDIATGAVERRGRPVPAEQQQAEGVHVDGRDGQLRRRQQGHVRRLGPAEPLEQRVHRRLRDARELPNRAGQAGHRPPDLLRRGAPDRHVERPAAGGQHASGPAHRAGLPHACGRGGRRAGSDRDHAHADPDVHPQPPERRVPRPPVVRDPVREHGARAHVPRAVLARRRPGRLQHRIRSRLLDQWDRRRTCSPTSSSGGSRLRTSPAQTRSSRS